MLREYGRQLIRVVEVTPHLTAVVRRVYGHHAVLAAEKFDDAMAVLAELRQPVDDFFDRVTVNSEDGKQRVNRLKLLSQIRSTMGEIADFGQIEG